MADRPQLPQTSPNSRTKLSPSTLSIRAVLQPRRPQVGGDAVVAVGGVIAFDEVEDVGRLARRGDAALLAVLEESAMLGAHLVVDRVAEQRTVGADADMVLAADIRPHARCGGADPPAAAGRAARRNGIR